MAKLTVTAENAEKVWIWLKERGGVSVWKSISLSDPGKQMLSPFKNSEGQQYTKPHWSLSDTPEVITRAEDIEVAEDHEVKRFHVGVRMGSQGFCLKVTDAGSARIRREVEKAGNGAYHVFDYGDYKNAVIMVPGRVVPLIEYAIEKGLS